MERGARQFEGRKKGRTATSAGFCRGWHGLLVGDMPPKQHIPFHACATCYTTTLIFPTR